MTDNCAHRHGPGTHESIRIAHLRECVEPHAPPLDLHLDLCPQCRPAVSRAATTQSEHHRMMQAIIRCPLYYRNSLLEPICSGSSPQPPLYEMRQVARINGIDEIAHLVRGTSSSELTARRRSTLVSSARRHAEHFRAEPPPPPCREVRRGPQPGVPIAPDPPCNLGNQRVDYSNPRA